MSAGARTELPTRRLHLTNSLPWRGAKWLFTVGFDTAGRAREIFVVTRVPVDGAQQAAASAFAITLSHELQRGARALQLVLDLRQSPHEMAPLMRLILLAAARMEREDGPAIHDAYLCADGKHPLQTGASTCE